MAWIKDKVPQIGPGYLASGANEGANLTRYGTFIKEYTSAAGPKEISAAIYGRLRAIDRRAYATAIGRVHVTSAHPGEVFWRFGLNKEAVEVLNHWHCKIPIGADECFFFPLKGKGQPRKEELDKELLDTVTEEPGTVDEPVILE